MIRQIPVQVIYRVRTSRLTQVALAALLILILALTAAIFNTKTLFINIDGKTVRVSSFARTVGGALTHTWLNIYPEDVVEPERNTLLTENLTVQVTRSNPVRLKVDSQIFVARTTKGTIGEALEELSQRYGLGIRDIDEVNVPRSESVAANMEINVRRVLPVRILVDNQELDTYLAPRTVAEALAKLGIALGEQDKVSLPLEQTVAAGDTIRVVRVTEQVETMQSEIPCQTVMQPADFPVGLPDRVLNSGASGLQEQTVRLTFEDGKEVEREVLNQRIITEPVSRVISRGSQTTVSRGGSNINFQRAYLMTATAYCIPGGTTASGAPVRWGVVAVDPRVIPLGTKVYVDGYGQAKALDTGGKIRGNRIDLYMNSREAALSWGVRTVVVYVQ
jgi:uncharacterized protein YabE (DUF348 family)